MPQNKFTVDLGSIKLTDQQKSNINTAIQKAVSAELAHVLQTGKIVLVPVRKWIKGPIIDGIVAVDVTSKFMQNIMK